MTHTIQHQYDEILNASLPGLEIHIVYNCESEITFDDEGGEESNRLIDMSVWVDGKRPPVFKIPRESDGQQAREFLAVLRESARQALWAKALREAKKVSDDEPTALNIAAERWQIFGSAKPIFSTGKPERDFVI